MKLLRLAPENTKFGFMRFRRVSYPLSAFLSIVSVLMFLFVGEHGHSWFKNKCKVLQLGDALFGVSLLRLTGPLRILATKGVLRLRSLRSLRSG